jgi:hypothetical protein
MRVREEGVLMSGCLDCGVGRPNIKSFTARKALDILTSAFGISRMQFGGYLIQLRSRNPPPQRTLTGGSVGARRRPHEKDEHLWAGVAKDGGE